MLKILFLLFLSTPSFSSAVGPITLLKEIEKKYRDASGIEMDVVKKLKIQLLEKEKKSEGVIKIKSGGRFKWEVTKPDKSMTLVTPDTVWVVEYPMDTKDRLTVIKSRKPKKNQSPAIVAFLMGQGSLTKNFKVTPGKTSEVEQELFLIAKSKDEVVQKMNIFLNKKDRLISRLSFDDAMGNQTEIEFKNTDFKKEFKVNEFEFTPPKDADVNVID